MVLLNLIPSHPFMGRDTFPSTGFLHCSVSKLPKGNNAQVPLWCRINQPTPQIINSFIKELQFQMLLQSTTWALHWRTGLAQQRGLEGIFTSSHRHFKTQDVLVLFHTKIPAVRWILHLTAAALQHSGSSSNTENFAAVNYWEASLIH